MQLENTFTVPTGIDDAWAAFNDPQRFAPCFPGATLESSDADSFVGTVKVKLGPISLTYKGKGTYLERDDAKHTVVIDASGRDARGNGTASAKVTGSLTAVSDTETSVKMVTDMTVTGRPAQFGRGVMADVSDKIIGQFASCLSTKLGPQADLGSAGAAASPAAAGSGAAGSGAAGAGAAAGAASSGAAASAGPAGSGAGGSVTTAAPTTTATSTNGAGPKLVSAPAPSHSEVDAIDLLDSAGAPVLKRLVPALVALLLLFVVVRRIKHRND